MTENKNEGFYQYPQQITLGPSLRLTKANMEHLRMLYKRSLDEKWIPIQKRLHYGNCAFCADADEECRNCKISPALCAGNGEEGLYYQWRSTFEKGERQKIADQMVSEMEARIVDCDIILTAMELGENIEYKCASCGDVFKSGLTKAEAIQQFQEEFPGKVWSADLPQVCEDCFQKMNEEIPTKEWSRNVAP